MKPIDFRAICSEQPFFGSGARKSAIRVEGLELPTYMMNHGGAAAADTSMETHINPDADHALDFIDQNHAPACSFVDRRKVVRKIDLRILPVMFICYWLQFVDKVLLNYAVVMGMPRELNLKANDISNTASAFFVAFLLTEIPTGMYALSDNFS